jgi:hypothetical protein
MNPLPPPPALRCDNQFPPMKINLDDLTTGEAKQLASLFSNSPALSAPAGKGAHE